MTAAITNLMGVAHRRPGRAGFIISNWCEALFTRTIDDGAINVREFIDLAGRSAALVEVRP